MGFCSVVFEFNKTVLRGTMVPSKVVLASALRRLLDLCRVAAAVSGAPPDTLREEDGMERESGGPGGLGLVLSSSPVITVLKPCCPSLEPASPIPAQPQLVISHRHNSGVVSCHPPYLRHRSLKGTRQQAPLSGEGVAHRQEFRVPRAGCFAQKPRLSLRVLPVPHSVCTAGECPVNEWATKESKGIQGSNHSLI